MSISLSKKQKVSLKKPDGSPLSSIFVGLGWDPAKKSGGGFLSKIFGGGGDDSIDLDALLLMMDEKKNPIDMVWFRQLDSKCGSVRHSGDNLTGEGDGDDEVIHVDLNRVPSNVKFLAIMVNSFRGQSFNEVDNCFARVVDTSRGKETEICNIKLRDQGSHTAVLIAHLTRTSLGFEFTADGYPAKIRTVDDIVVSCQENII